MDGERLAELRKDKGLTQMQLGKQLNVSPCTISSYETGYRQVPDDIKVIIADLFGVSIDYLMGRVREPDNMDTLVKRLPPKAKQEIKLYVTHVAKKYSQTKQAGSEANPQR